MGGQKVLDRGGRARRGWTPCRRSPATRTPPPSTALLTVTGGQLVAAPRAAPERVRQEPARLRQPLPPAARHPRRPRLHRGQPDRPAPHGDAQRQRGHHDRRVPGLVRAGRGRHRDGPRRDGRGRALHRPAGGPLRAGQDRGARDRARRARLPRAGALRPLRRPGLDALRRVRRHRDHPQHRRDVPGPLGASPPGRPGGPAHRELLRTGRRRALLHARPGPRGGALRGAVPGGGHAGGRVPADDRASWSSPPSAPRSRRRPLVRARPSPRSARRGCPRCWRSSSPRGRCSGRWRSSPSPMPGGAILALQAAGSCAAGLLYGSLRPAAQRPPQAAALPGRDDRADVPAAARRHLHGLPAASWRSACCSRARRPRPPWSRA